MTDNAKKTCSFNKPSEIINLGITLLLMFGFRYLPAPEPISVYGMGLLGVFLGLIYGWCFCGDTLFVSFLGLVGLGSVLPSGVYGALSTLFSGYVPILILVSFFTMGALMGANISEWLVYKVCTAKFAKGKPWLLMAVIFYGSWVVGVLTSPIIVAFFLLSIYNVLFEQAGFKPGEKTPVMIVMNTCIFSVLASIVFPWGPPQVMVLSALQTSLGIIVEYSQYVTISVLFNLLYIGVSLIAMRIMKCEVHRFIEIDFSFLEGKYSKGLDSHQKAVLVGMLSVCFGCLAISFFPKNLPIYAFVTGQFGVIGWMILVAAIMIFVKVDGKRLLEPKDLAKHYPWDIVFMVSLGVTIGTMITSDGTGISIWLSSTFGPILSSTSGFALTIVCALLALILTNFLNNNVIVIMFATSVIALASQGLIADPIVPCIVIILAGNIGYYTPAASIAGALNHAHAYTTPKAIYKYGLAVFVFAALFCALVVPFIVNLVI